MAQVVGREPARGNKIARNPAGNKIARNPAGNKIARNPAGDNAAGKPGRRHQPDARRARERQGPGTAHEDARFDG